MVVLKLEWLLVKEEQHSGKVVVEGYLWHGNWYVSNILIVVMCRLEMGI
jgi:hypothetical protein